VVALSRFTLLDLPQWPIPSFFALWVLVQLLITSNQRISAGQSARYLDRVLSLDERLGTLFEIARSTPVQNLSPAPPRVPTGLLEDAAFQVKARRTNLPSPGNSSREGGKAL